MAKGKKAVEITETVLRDAHRLRHGEELHLMPA